MTLQREAWAQDNYNKLVAMLFDAADQDYLAFNRRIIPETKPMIGVRMPQLKQLAKQIAKGNVESFLAQLGGKYYETVLLRGLVIGYWNCSVDNCLSALKRGYIPQIDNWALCDLAGSNLQQFHKHKAGEAGFTFAKTCLPSKNPWEVRFGLVLLLDYYLDEPHLDEVVDLAVTLNHSAYYVNMAVAWLLATAYLRRPETIQNILRSRTLPERDLHNRTIQKLIDSKRVSDHDKETLRQLRWRR